MTKAELLVDLQSRPQIKTLLGDAEDITPEGDIPLGVKWYQQEVFEVLNDAAVKRTVTFYVMNEGDPEEWAAYKDAAPTEHVQPNQFEMWLNMALASDPDAVSWRIITKNETIWHSLTAVLETGVDGLDMVGYLCTRDSGTGALVKQKLNLTVDQMMTVLANRL